MNVADQDRYLDRAFKHMPPKALAYLDKRGLPGFIYVPEKTCFTKLVPLMAESVRRVTAHSEVYDFADRFEADSISGARALYFPIEDNVYYHVNRKERYNYFSLVHELGHAIDHKMGQDKINPENQTIMLSPNLKDIVTEYVTKRELGVVLSGGSMTIVEHFADAFAIFAGLEPPPPYNGPRYGTFTRTFLERNFRHLYKYLNDNFGLRS